MRRPCTGYVAFEAASSRFAEHALNPNAYAGSLIPISVAGMTSLLFMIPRCSAAIRLYAILATIF